MPSSKEFGKHAKQKHIGFATHVRPNDYYSEILKKTIKKGLSKFYTKTAFLNCYRQELKTKFAYYF